MDFQDKKISLLPEEMRKKEMEEAKRRTPVSEEAKLHIPSPEKKEVWAKPIPKEEKKPSFLASLFGSSEKRAEKKRKAEEQKKQSQVAKETERRIKAEAKKTEIKKSNTPATPVKVPMAVSAPKPVQPVPPASQKSSFPKPVEPTKMSMAPVATKKEERKVEEVPHGMRVSLLSQEMLVPEESRFAGKLLAFILTQSIVALVLLGGYFWMVWQESQVKTTEGNINEQLRGVELSIAEKEKELADARGLQSRIGLFKGLLDSHLYWTQFLSALEGNTVQGVYYTSIAADASGGVVLSARASNYETVARQMVALMEAKDLVASVRVNSAVGDVGEGGVLTGVNFDVHVSALPSVFHK